MDEFWRDTFRPLMAPLRAVRFSLATLLLAVCFVASVIAVWVNREPWEIAARVVLPDPSIYSGTRIYSKTIGLYPLSDPGQILVTREHKSHRMAIWNWHTGELTPVPIPESEILLEVAPAAGRFLTSDRSGTARIRQIGSENPLVELPHWIFPTAANPRISPDGNRIAASGPDGTVWIYDLATQTEKSIPARSESPEYVYLEFSANGRWLCAAERKKEFTTGWQLIDCDQGARANVTVPEEVDAWATKTNNPSERSFLGSSEQLFLVCRGQWSCWWIGTTRVQQCPGSADNFTRSADVLLFFTNLTLTSDRRQHTATFEIWSRDLSKQLGAVSPDLPVMGNWLVSDDGMQLILNPIDRAGDTSVLSLWSTVTGKQLYTFPTPLWGRHFLNKNHLLCQVESKPELQVWRRRRPEYAWGLLALPEFWLVPIFLVATIVSVRRDRRRLKGAATCVKGRSEAGN